MREEQYWSINSITLHGDKSPEIEDWTYALTLLNAPLKPNKWSQTLHSDAEFIFLLENWQSDEMSEYFL